MINFWPVTFAPFTHSISIFCKVLFFSYLDFKPEDNVRAENVSYFFGYFHKVLITNSWQRGPKPSSGWQIPVEDSLWQTNRAIGLCFWRPWKKKTHSRFLTVACSL